MKREHACRRERVKKEKEENKLKNTKIKNRSNIKWNKLKCREKNNVYY